MNDEQLLRYSRQILLPSVGIEGQQRLLNSKIAIIGLGGLGSPVAMYLASAGVGHLRLIDDDRVEISNLQRQIVHDTSRIGQSKSISAKVTLKKLNPDIDIHTHELRLDSSNIDPLLRNVDAILDCTDNFSTRDLINQFCVQSRTPLISAAVIRLEGQVCVFSNQVESACYRCLYPDFNQTEETCSENGILAPVAGLLGSIQATEALRYLIDGDSALNGQLLVFDATTMTSRTLKLNRDENCPVCGENRKSDNG